MRNLIALAVALGTLSGAAFGAELAPMRPLTETPDVTATPGRELAERRLAAELRIW
ncbi:MAG: hypothetical protein HQL39_16565 [Alphaproteobacteria bacterium]|nr:hypothetical protein [Alphaproteobacteria bacterium]